MSTEVVAEIIGVTDDGQLVEIYVEAPRFHRPVLWIAFFATLTWAAPLTLYYLIGALS